MLTDEQIEAAAAAAKAALLAQGESLGFDERIASAAAATLAATLRAANKQAASLAQTPLRRDDVVFGFVLANVLSQQVAALTALVGTLLARLPGAKDDPDVQRLLAEALTTEKIAERIAADYGPLPNCDGCRRSSPAACYHHARCADCRNAEERRKPGRPWREGFCAKHPAQ